MAIIGGAVAGGVVLMAGVGYSVYRITHRSPVVLPASSGDPYQGDDVVSRGPLAGGSLPVPQGMPPQAEPKQLQVVDLEGDPYKV